MTSTTEDRKIDPTKVDTLLERLSTDDAFRELFARDPAKALTDIGYDLPDGCPPQCSHTTVLAPKEEIAAARKALRAHLLDSRTSMTVIFNFEAGKVEQSLGKY